MVSRTLFFLLLPASWVLAQCPQHLPEGVLCQTQGGTTTLDLQRDAIITWDRFFVPADGALIIRSQGPTAFSSQHQSTRPAQIAGQIVADGPLTISSPNGLNHRGSIQAPSVTLSALAQNPDGTFSASGRRGNLSSSGTITASKGDVTLLGRSIDHSGNIQAPQGKVRMTALDRGRVSPTTSQLPPSASSRARVQNSGRAESASIEILTDGFFRNRGRLAAQGRLGITADTITHDRRPGSILSTTDLRLDPDAILEGPVVNPNDGANPGGRSTTIQFPDLANNSFRGRTVTTLRPTQFSASTVPRARLSSPLPEVRRQKVAQKRRQQSLAARGQKKTLLRKRSFFGQITTKKP